MPYKLGALFSLYFTTWCVVTFHRSCSVETLKLVSPIKKTKAPNERWPKVPRIEYPEDRLVQSYYARHPEVRSLHHCQLEIHHVPCIDVRDCRTCGMSSQPHSCEGQGCTEIDIISCAVLPAWLIAHCILL